MAVNPGLLQAIADPFNTSPENPEEESFSPQVDRTTAALLQSDIDPVAKAIIRRRAEDRVRRQRLEFELQKTQKPPEPSPGLVSWLGPIPIGFQLGTWAGIEHPVLRFLTDIVVDPVNLLGGIGGLTKLGRASKFLKGLTPAQKASKLIEGAEFMAKLGLDDGLTATLRQAAAEGGAKGSRQILAAFKKLKKVELTADQIAELAAKTGDSDFFNLLKNRRAEKAGLTAAFQFAKDRSVGEFKEKFLDRVLAGQSAFVNLSVPFTGMELGNLRFPRLLKSIMGDSAEIQKSLKGAEKLAKEIGEELIPIQPRLAPLGEALDPKNNEAVLGFLNDSLGTTKDLASRKNLIDTFKTDQWTAAGVPFGNVAQATMTGFHNTGEMARHALNVLFKGDTKLLEAFSAAREGKNTAGFLAGLNAAQVEAFNQIDDTFAFLGQRLVETRAARALIEDYVPHLIEITNPSQFAKYKDGLFSKLAKSMESSGEFFQRADLPRGKHGMPRTFRTFDEIDEFLKQHPTAGFKVRERRIDKIFPEYVASVGRSLVRNQSLATLQRVKNTDDLPFALKLRTRGQRTAKGRSAEILQRNLDMYERIEDNPAFEGWYLHRDIHRGMNALYGRGMPKGTDSSNLFINKLSKGLNYANNLAKGSLFNVFPFFHAASLTFAQFATLPANVAARNIVDVGRFAFASDPVKQSEGLLRMMSRATSGTAELGNTVLKADDLVQLMLTQSGMKFAGGEGYQVLQKALQGVAERLPKGIRSPVTGLEHWNNMADHGLWRIYHDGMKQISWMHLMNRALKKDPGILDSSAQLFKVAQDVGAHVDTSFGGMFDRLLIHPKVKDVLRWAMLAPDWTLSNLMAARDMFVNMPGLRETALGKRFTADVLLPDLRFRMAMAYNLRAGTYAYLFSNALNYLFTGKWLFENDEQARDRATGLKTRIELPYKRSDGRRQFMDITKQFAEPMKLIHEGPFQFYKSKMGIFPRAFQTLVVGMDSYGNPVYGTADGPFKQTIERIAETTGQFWPITIQAAVEAVEGKRDPRSTLISSFAGVNISTENKNAFEKRKRIEELKRQLAVGVR